MPASVEGYASAAALNFVSAASERARSVGKLGPAPGVPGASGAPTRASADGHGVGEQRLRPRVDALAPREIAERDAPTMTMATSANVVSRLRVSNVSRACRARSSSSFSFR